MPSDKKRLIRLQTLDRCFSNHGRHYYIDDLVDECREALKREGVKNPDVSPRTIRYDIQAMEGNTQWNVLLKEKAFDGHKRYYQYADPHYSIFGNDLTEDQLNELKSMLISLRQLKGLPQFDKMEDLIEQLEDKYGFRLPETDSAIEFEQNEYLHGLEHLSALFSAVVYKRPIRFTYSPYGKKKTSPTVHPYYLKQYNSRWFLFGKIDGTNFRTLTNFALDRISDIEQSPIAFVECEVDYEDYFDGLVGVSSSEIEKPVEVHLRFTERRLPYVISKPLHHSQTLVKGDPNVLKIRVRPNKELIQKLLSFGCDVEVLPSEEHHVREMMAEEIKKMTAVYKTLQ